MQTSQEEVRWILVFLSLDFAYFITWYSRLQFMFLTSLQSDPFENACKIKTLLSSKYLSLAISLKLSNHFCLRFCAVTSLCGNHVLKEERPCRGGSGRRRQGRHGRRRRRQRQRRQRGFRNNRCASSNKSWKSRVHIVKKKGLSRPTLGMLRYNKAFYSKWSKWSGCEDNCRTTRSR